MYTLEYAYELADQYTAKTNGYTRVSIERYNFNHPAKEVPYSTYILSGQDLLHTPFDSIDALVERLKELLSC